MNEGRPLGHGIELGDGIELVCENAFFPEGKWSIRKSGMVWSKVEGWRKDYEVKRSDTHFETAEDAMKAWQQRGKVQTTD